MTLGQFFQLLSLVMLVVILGLGNQMVTSIALHIILIVLMFFCRVGVMTISQGFLLSDQAGERYRFAETKVLIG